MKRLAFKAVAYGLLLLAPLPGAAPDDPALREQPLILEPGPAYAAESRRFQSVPGVARTPRGRLWATWYGGGTGEGPENYVMLAYSDDDGDSWSEVQAVIDGEGEVRAFAPVVWVDPQGRLWWFHHQSYRWWDGRAGVWAVMCSNPDAPDPHWSGHRRIADGVMMNKPTVLSSGEWLLPVAVWSHEPRKNLPSGDGRHVPAANLRWDTKRTGTYVYCSRDWGESFERLGGAKLPDVRFDEHMIVERSDGALWMLARARTGSFLTESESHDRGRTWTGGRPSTIPHIDSRFFIRRLRSGRLLLVKHNPGMDSAWLAQTKPGFLPKSWRHRSHLTAYLSEDDGRTWKGGLLLDDRLVVAYPDGDQAQDGTIFITYDFNRHTDKEILLARFTEEDVKAGRLVSSRSRLRLLVNKATGADSR